MSIKKNFFAPLASGLGATRRAAVYRRHGGCGSALLSERACRRLDVGHKRRQDGILYKLLRLPLGLTQEFVFTISTETLRCQYAILTLHFTPVPVLIM